MQAERRTETTEAMPSQPSQYDPPPPPYPQAQKYPRPVGNTHQMAARGFGQIIGLHPIPAVLTLSVNAMLFGGTIITMGALAPLALIVAVILGIITYRSQKCFYGDDHEAALIKALAVGLVTAIPVGLPSILTLPSGVVGFVHNLRRKNSND